ncbi:M42 family peptidase [Nostoc sp. FACHB-87]|uniref:M42 family metallopeptidase n=1 Tax=Nostocales TaxID=1161 RepID=UPI0016843C24|nr:MULTISPECIES: M42 family peptidase [Nostocales]MBD2456971.1 M42 family peptidase [Nostoc sp. FACHB-87]MBD2479974.1 M42 family peptidase [Anabaena sp. FACHB-83]MBD2491272.1 M42 family peptidase [Aulosira sp. FACHB-615]
MWDYEQLFKIIEELVMHHSPSGVEGEINQFLLQQFAALGVEVWSDRADNIIAKIPGKDSTRAIAITAHKDEIGAIVKTVGEAGKVEVRKLGGAFPWVYGEGVVDLLGDNETISGILSFGSRHVSHESPQKVQQEDTPVKWENAWIETKRTTAQLEAAGIRPGTRMVVGKHRKHPIRLNNHIASYTLDNKASVAILLGLAQTLKQPGCDVYLVASAKEEVGAIGALFFTQNQQLDALIALEICPLSPEYPIQDNESPVLLSQDAYGIYDETLNLQLCRAAKQLDITLQLTILSGFGSDASIAMKFGHVGRASCLAFPTQNTHGYEIAHLGAIANCINLLKGFCETFTE